VMMLLLPQLLHKEATDGQYYVCSASNQG
jgi:hypothetical protein